MKVSCTLRFKRSFYHSKLKLNVNFSWTVSSLFKSVAHFLLELHSKRGEDGRYDYVNPGSYTAISRKVVGKSARDNPERYCGWF